MWPDGDSYKTLIRERYSLAKELRSQQLEYHRKKQKERKRFKIGGGWKVSTAGEKAIETYLYTYAESSNFSVKMNLEGISSSENFLKNFLPSAKNFILNGIQRWLL